MDKRSYEELEKELIELKPTLNLMGLPKEITFVAKQIEEYVRE
jgi:hypothetical protein